MDNEYAPVVKSDKWIAIQTESTLPLESINSKLLALQTAFPTIVRNYDQHEFEALQNLWYDIFKNVPEQLMNEAIKRFIIADRKGFFPSPGQIIGYIEQIVEEQQAAEERQKMLEYQEEMRKQHDLIYAGERCENCIYCRVEKTVAEGYIDELGNMIAVVKPATTSYFCECEKSRKYVVSTHQRCEYFSWQNKKGE